MQSEVNTPSIGELFRIAIVDDDASSRELLRKHLTALCASHGYRACFFEYETGVALLLETPPDLDILFIDIDMPHMDGISTVSSLREYYRDLAVVFVTAHEEYAIASYTVHARRYILKPLNAVLFEHEITPLLADVVSARSDRLALHSEDGVHVLRARDGMYFTTAHKKHICVVTSKGRYVCRGSLSEWEAQTDTTRFVRCHSGFLLNLAYVAHVGTTEITLLTDELVPLSKHRRRAFLEAFSVYVSTAF